MPHNGMGRHQSATNESDEWLTPPEIIKALGRPFDLDPCSAPLPRPWETAKHYWTKDDDGLGRPWKGSVFLNPPYGGPTIVGPWMKKMAAHGNGVALIFARTETEVFHRYVWESASAVLFLRGRLYFHRPDGSRAAANAGAPSCLIAYGLNNATRLARSGIRGKIVVI